MTKKLDKQHLDAIQTLRNAFIQNATELGYVTIEENRLQQQLASIQQTKTQYIAKTDELIQQEETLLASLKDAYGEGQIDIQSGTFTPAE
jgi:hypothetical protein